MRRKKIHFYPSTSSEADALQQTFFQVSPWFKSIILFKFHFSNPALCSFLCELVVCVYYFSFSGAERTSFFIVLTNMLFYVRLSRTTATTSLSQFMQVIFNTVMI